MKTSAPPEGKTCEAPARRTGWRLSEPEPPRGQPLQFRPGIRRIVAPNPSPMTYHGTNCWLIDTPQGTVVLDPGSDDPAHLDAIEREANSVALILLTHTHTDHLTGVAELVARTGARTAAYRRPATDKFTPDLPLDDGDEVAGLRAIHTPGHAMDHLCFATNDAIVFVGDHIMGWSTSVVPPPPTGSLPVYVDQLARMRDMSAAIFLSGHGPAIMDPTGLAQALITHRLAREASIVALLGDTPQDLDTLFPRAYPTIKRGLNLAATVNLLGHLDKIVHDGRAVLTTRDPPVVAPERTLGPSDMSCFDNMLWSRAPA